MNPPIQRPARTPRTASVLANPSPQVTAGFEVESGPSKIEVATVETRCSQSAIFTQANTPQ